MFLIAWVILGVVSGLIVNKLVYREEPGFVGDCVIGLVGALTGGFVFNVVVAHGMADLNPWSMAFAAIGALLMLGAFHALRRAGRGFRQGT